MNDHTDPEPVDVEALAGRLLAVLPSLSPEEQRLAVSLYRLLENGAPVSHQELADAAGLPVVRVDRIVEGWDGIYHEDGRIIGFWGLTGKSLSAHQFRTGGRTNFAWCAWDTLFLPELLGRRAEVESRDPETGETIRLTVSPDGVERVEPEGAVLSFLEPYEGMREDVIGNFCHFIHFFASPDSARRWMDAHPGTLMLSIAEGFELGQRRNREQLGEGLNRDRS